MNGTIDQAQKGATGQRVRNVVLTVLFGCFFFAALAQIAADALVPDFAVERNNDLEGAQLADPAALAELPFEDGSLQGKAEQVLSDWVPARDDLLLLTSGLQRQGIASAAKAFGFRVYPTYFGSDNLEDAVAGRQLEMPAKKPTSAKRRKQLTRAINKAARANPEVRFAVNYVLQPSQTKVNPAYKLMGGKGFVNEKWVSRKCIDPLDDSITAWLTTVDESADNFSTFTTDHHWTLERALDSYNELASAWGLAEVPWNESHERLVTPSWYGNYARNGLDTNFASELVDLDTDFSNLTFHALSDGSVQPPERSGLREQFYAEQAGELEHARFASMYMQYYGEANSDIENAGENNGKTCLLVGDSFSLCLKRYIAANYARTICILPGNVKVSKNLQSFIEDYDVDDVIVMMHPQKSRFIANLSPNFMKVNNSN